MRQLIEIFERSFLRVHTASMALLEQTDDRRLYERPRELPMTFAMFSVGEYLLRSAATVEQTFGGIRTRLWDDPFEWTLPEQLDSCEKVAEYLREVRASFSDGFTFLRDDKELLASIPSPIAIRPIADILLETLARSEHYQGRAFAVYQMLSDQKLPRA